MALIKSDCMYLPEVSIYGIWQVLVHPDVLSVVWLLEQTYCNQVCMLTSCDFLCMQRVHGRFDHCGRWSDLLTRLSDLFPGRSLVRASFFSDIDIASSGPRTRVVSLRKITCLIWRHPIEWLTFSASWQCVSQTDKPIHTQLSNFTTCHEQGRAEMDCGSPENWYWAHLEMVHLEVAKKMGPCCIWELYPLVFAKIFRLRAVMSNYVISDDVRCTTWLCESIIYWQMCSRWKWRSRSSAADWRRSDTKRPPLHAWVWSAQVGVREPSMQARRKARRASCECKPGAESNLGRARNCWKIGNAILHLHTNKCVHSMELCLWAPKLWERVCAGRCYTTCGSNDWRVFTSSPSQPCKIEFCKGVQPKPGAGDLAIEPSKLEFWWWFQPKPGAGDPAIGSSKFEFWW